MLLILGDGRCLKEDLELFLTFNISCDIGAIGRAIKEYPGRVLHWFNADGECAGHWAKNLPNGNGTIKHTLGWVDGFDYDWEVKQPDYHYGEITNETDRLHGSTSLFAVLASLTLGYREIILAGCPLDTEGHWYFEPSNDTFGPLWLGVDYMAWLDFAGMPESSKVKSMSGYTAKILGYPSYYDL